MKTTSVQPQHEQDHHGNQEPSRARNQEPLRALRTSQPNEEAQLVRAPACVPLDLASRPLERVRLGEQPPRFVLEHIEILLRRASRPTVSNHGKSMANPWQSRVINFTPANWRAIKGHQLHTCELASNQGSSTSHLRIGEQPIDSLSHHTRDLLRRLHQTDHATIARDALRARVLQHQFPEQLTCGEGRVRRGEHLHAATSIPGAAHRRRRPAPATPTRRQVSPAVAVLVRGDGPSRSDQQVPT